MSITFLNQQQDASWGCSYRAAESAVAVEEIKLCFVEVQNLQVFAQALTDQVLDNSWMVNLDRTSRRALARTVDATATKLVEMFNETASANCVKGDFGEVMVSIGSARALEGVFKHMNIPLAELWKSQVRQNGGFDFHTVCGENFINFGEAKYSSNASPYAEAINQAGKFLDEEKHLNDGIHLQKLVSPVSIDLLDNDEFGVVAAFSVNAKKPELILANALAMAQGLMSEKKIKRLYLVGVR